ncbi:uncharacterized protein si:ch211-106e7.2 [Nematolebias whitei]|uniref:uncharacterized protein si:ch211-106e7.2 n=1 Tax=Nematolebias whitei TaxID=451745 RepID=UPI00189B34C9|nr:uncharacterized protein si:ch211-106e7.2 [Nematolebias whitei]
MVNLNTFVLATTQNVQTSQVAPIQFGQNCAEDRLASGYQTRQGTVTSQPFGNGNVVAQSFSNGQALHIFNTSQTQQPTTHLCSYNSWGEPVNSRSTNMMNQDNSSFLVKSNDVPLNPGGGSQQMLRYQAIADSLSNSHTVSSDECPPSYDSHHFVSIPQMSTQNIQPVTSAHSENFNFNTTQSLSLDSGQSGQSLSQSAMSIGHLTSDAPLQQMTLPEVFSINSEISKRRKTVKDLLSGNTRISKETPVGLTSLSSPVKQIDKSVHSMPGHTGTRAVAIVQPLSQENEHSSNTAIYESVNIPEKECIKPNLSKDTEAPCLMEESDLNQENLNPEEASEAASHDGSVLPDYERRSALESPAQKPSEVPANQTCSKVQKEMVSPPLSPVLDLSSLPTNAWTVEGLNKLILETEKAQPESQVDSKQSIIVKLIIMFWNKNVKALLQNYKAGASFALNVEKICTRFSEKSVILSEVKPDFKDHLKQYHILDNAEIYSEQPYKSQWLNVNHQLDDIDKEFGFPWVLKQHLYVHEVGGSIPEQIISEVQNKILSRAEPESVDLVKEKEVCTVESTPHSLSSKKKPDVSCDSDHSFKIEVLPPEEARSIYEQVQNQTHPSTSCENVTALNGSLQTQVNKDAGATLKTHNMENKSDDKIKEICCLARFMEMYSIPDLPSSKCLCKVERSCIGKSVKTPKPDTDNPAKSKDVIDCRTITLSASELCSKLDQIIDLTEKDDKSSPSFQETETEQDMEIISHSCNNKLFPFSQETENLDQEAERISKISNNSQLHNFLKSEDDDLSAIDFVTASSPFTLEISETESEDNCQQELKSTEAIQLSTFVSSANKIQSDKSCSIETENVLQLSDQEENCRQVYLKLVEKAESALESKGTQTAYHQSSHSVRNKQTKTKRNGQSGLDLLFPELKMQKQCKRSIELDSDISEAQPSSSEAKTVELVLFGSGQKEQGSLPENKKRDTLSPSIFFVKYRPPAVLSVNLDPPRRKSLDTVGPETYSAKQLIYERWRKTFHPTLNGSFMKSLRNKLKRQKHLSASLSSSLKKQQWSASSKVQVPDGTSKNPQSLKRRRSFSLLRRREKVKRRRYSVTLEQPANREEKGTQNGNPAVKPLLENIVLKFSVLPDTFHFKDESSRVKDTSDSVSGMPEPQDDQSPQKSDPNNATSKDVWYSTTKQCQPLPAPQMDSLFHEYQKIYKKSHLSTDEPNDL